MDGNKKIARIYIPIIALLAFVSCNVQKPIGISLFESIAVTIPSEAIIKDSLILPLSADSVFMAKNLVSNLDLQTEDIKSESGGIDSVFLHKNLETTFEEQAKVNQQDTVGVDSLLQAISAYNPDREAETSMLQNLVLRLDSMLISQKSIINKSDSINTLLLQYLLRQSYPPEKRDTIVIINQIFLSDLPKSDFITMTDSSYLSSNESRLLLDSISVLHSEVNIIKAELASFSDKRTTDQNTLISPDFNTPLNPNEENTSHNSSIILKEKSDTILHLKEENLRLKNELANRVQLSEIMSAKNNSITVSDTIDSPDKNPDETVLPVIIDKRMNIDSLALKSFYSDTILIDESENIDSTLSRPPYPRLIKDDHKSIKDSLNSVAKIEFPESIPKENEDQGKTELNTDLYTRDTLLIAYFHSGETTAFNEEEVLFAVNMIFSTEKVENIFLSAYTDISGTPAINMSISKMRADLIHKKLLDLGIPRELIFMQYFGSTYALQQIDKKDRRVEVLISY